MDRGVGRPSGRDPPDRHQGRRDMSPPNRNHTTGILVALTMAIAAAIGVTVVYALGGQAQLEGTFLGLGLGGVAVALILFARRMLPHGHFVQVRQDPAGSQADRSSVE